MEKKDDIIIPVDDTHRIRITKRFSGKRNQWGWELNKEKFFRFFWFTKGWHSSSWEEKSGELFMEVTTYYVKEMALNEAEYIKKKYLENK